MRGALVGGTCEARGKGSGQRSVGAAECSIGASVRVRCGLQGGASGGPRDRGCDWDRALGVGRLGWLYVRGCCECEWEWDCCDVRGWYFKLEAQVQG